LRPDVEDVRRTAVRAPPDLVISARPPSCVRGGRGPGEVAYSRADTFARRSSALPPPSPRQAPGATTPRSWRAATSSWSPTSTRRPSRAAARLLVAESVKPYTRNVVWSRDRAPLPSRAGP